MLNMVQISNTVGSLFSIITIFNNNLTGPCADNESYTKRPPTDTAELSTQWVNSQGMQSKLTKRKQNLLKTTLGNAAEKNKMLKAVDC